MGWTLDVGSIRRDTGRRVPVKWTTGTPSVPLEEYDDGESFVFAVAGASGKLVDVGGTYCAEIERSFMRFDLLTTGWVVTAKDGTKFYFGDTNESPYSRMVNPDWTGTSNEQTYAWMLSHVVAANGNKIVYEYYDPAVYGNHPYLRRIAYNAHTFNGFGATHEVNFVLEDRDGVGGVKDDHFSYRSGYRVDTNMRLAEINNRVLVSGAWNLARKYVLTYTQSPDSSRSLLTSITEYGSNGTTALPPVTFEYSGMDFEFEDPVSWGPLLHQQSNPFGSTDLLEAWNAPMARTTGLNDGADGPFTRVNILDMNRDGLPDRTLTDYDAFPDGNDEYLVQHNLGNAPDGTPLGMDLTLYSYPFTDTTGMANPVHRASLGWTASGFAREGESHLKIIDLDGDGFVDRVHDGSFQAGSPTLEFLVEFGSASGFAPKTTWGPIWVDPLAGSFPEYSPFNNPEYVMPDENDGIYGSQNLVGALTTMLMDVTGDGKPDRILRYHNNEAVGARDAFYIQVNNGAGFDGVQKWTLDTPYNPSPQVYNDYWKNPVVNETGGQSSINTRTPIGLYDLNGDGLPDRVTKFEFMVGNTYDNFTVAWNTGHGFTPWETFGPLEYHDPVYEGHEYLGSPASSMDATTPCGTDGSCTLSMLQDVNGDGLLDKLMVQDFDFNPTKPYDTWSVQLNHGAGFGPVRDYNNISRLGVAQPQNPSAYIFPSATRTYAHSNDLGQQAYAVMHDMNGDGLIDRVMRANVGTTGPLADGYQVQFAKGELPDLLVKVNSGMGGSLNVEYTPSTSWDNTDDQGVSHLASRIQTVSHVELHDGMGSPPQSTDYSYQGGVYDYDRREFRGFHCVTAVDSLGTKTNTFFHQGGGIDGSATGEYQDSGSFAKKGIPYRQEVTGNDAQLYSATVNKVEELELPAGSGRFFPFVSQTAELTYEGLGVPRISLTQNTYDFSNGNMLQEDRLGEVASFDPGLHTFSDTPGDDTITTAFAYATLTNPDIIDKPELVTLKDHTGTRTNESKLSYAGNGLVLSEQQWLNWKNGAPANTYVTTASYLYDNYGNVVRITDAVGTITTKAYATEHQAYLRNSSVDPAGVGFVTLFSIDPLSGLPLTVTDMRGLVHRYTYDVHFRLDKSWLDFPSGGGSVLEEDYSYFLGGVVGGNSFNYVRHRLNDTSDADGHVTTTYLDGRGRPIQVRSESETVGQERVSNTLYDQRGQVEYETVLYESAGSTYTSYVQGSEPETRTLFDPIGRVSRVRPPSGDPGSPTGDLLTEYVDGSDPWVHVVTDAELKKVKTARDGHGRVSQVAEVFGGSDLTTTYEYDTGGNLVLVEDALGNRIEMTFDSMSRRVALDDPDMRGLSFEYDDAGRLVEQEDQTLQRIVSTYDSVGRVLTREMYGTGDTSPEETITYEYDSNTVDPTVFPVYKGQLYRMTDGEGWTKHGYDIRAREVKTRRRVDEANKSYTISREFDEADRVSRITYPGNFLTLDYVYDTGGRLQSVTSVAATPVTFYDAKGHTGRGQLEGITFGNGVETDFEYYSSSGRLKRIHTYDDSSVDLQDLSYEFDGTGNLLELTDGVAAHTGASSSSRTGISYDDLHRITGYTRPTATGSETISFNYNAIGNVLLNTDNGIGQYSYPSSGASSIRPHAVTSANGYVYIYDDNGNLSQRQGGGNRSLTYDARDQLTRVDNPDGSVVHFGYDGGGSRLYRKVGTKRTVWIEGLYEERDNRKVCHVMAGGRRVCSYSVPLKFAFGVEPKVYQYFHEDHLLGTNIVTDVNGDLAHNYTYTAFGDEAFTGNYHSYDPSNLFTDQVLDGATGLYYFNSRYYDPVLGRFIQPDSIIPDYISPQLLNRYTYVGNNPYRWVDNTGHWPEWPRSWGEFKTDALVGTGQVFNFVGGVFDGITFGAYGAYEDGLNTLVNGEQEVAQYRGHYEGTRTAGEWASIAVGGAGAARGAARFAGRRLVASSADDLARLGGNTFGSRVAIGAADDVVRAVGTTSYSSAKLTKNLARVGYVKRAGEHAHHIVPLNAKAAKPARDALARWGIGLDDAANGVLLPGTKEAAKALGSSASVHLSLHAGSRGKQYYDVLNQAIGSARSREAAIGALENIRTALQAGIL